MSLHPALAAKVPALIGLCREHGVRSLDVFGSATRPEEFDAARSDVDLVVEFLDPDLGPWLRRLFEFQRAAEALLGRRVDVQLRSAVEGSRLGRSIEGSKVTLYAAA